MQKIQHKDKRERKIRDKKPKIEVVKFSRKKLTGEILTEAKVLGIHPGAAKVIADKVVDKVEIWAKQRTMITKTDLDRAVAKEIKKYHADLAYVYQNRGKII